MPDPRSAQADALLEGIARERRGAALKVFLGAAPGVGKTYAMLSAARELKRRGIDVVVGIVETHGRAETAALTEGLELLPRRRVEYRDRTLEELDLDALLARKPKIALVDELAHSNAPAAAIPTATRTCWNCWTPASTSTPRSTSSTSRARTTWSSA
jgi:two-component system sensor histidine kinase KdpD